MINSADYLYKHMLKQSRFRGEKMLQNAPKIIQTENQHFLGIFKFFT